MADGLGDSELLHKALSAREGQLNEARGKFAAVAEIPSVDFKALEADLANRVEHWRGLLTRQVPQARQIVRKLLPSPLRFVPHGERLKGYFEFEGQAALGRLLFGAAGCPEYGGVPTGIENLWTIPVVGTTRDLTAA